MSAGAIRPVDRSDPAANASAARRAGSTDGHGRFVAGEQPDADRPARVRPDRRLHRPRPASGRWRVLDRRLEPVGCRAAGRPRGGDRRRRAAGARRRVGRGRARRARRTTARLPRSARSARRTVARRAGARDDDHRRGEHEGRDRDAGRCARAAVRRRSPDGRPRDDGLRGRDRRLVRGPAVGLCPGSCGERAGRRSRRAPRPRLRRPAAATDGRRARRGDGGREPSGADRGDSPRRGRRGWHRTASRSCLAARPRPRRRRLARHDPDRSRRPDDGGRDRGHERG